MVCYCSSEQQLPVQSSASVKPRKKSLFHNHLWQSLNWKQDHQNTFDIVRILTATEHKELVEGISVARFPTTSPQLKITIKHFPITLSLFTFAVGSLFVNYPPCHFFIIVCIPLKCPSFPKVQINVLSNVSSNKKKTKGSAYFGGRMQQFKQKLNARPFPIKQIFKFGRDFQQQANHTSSTRKS